MSTDSIMFLATAPNPILVPERALIHPVDSNMKISSYYVQAHVSSPPASSPYPPRLVQFSSHGPLVPCLIPRAQHSAGAYFLTLFAPSQHPNGRHAGVSAVLEYPMHRTGSPKMTHDSVTQPKVFFDFASAVQANLPHWVHWPDLELSLARRAKGRELLLQHPMLPEPGEVICP